MTGAAVERLCVSLCRAAVHERSFLSLFVQPVRFLSEVRAAAMSHRSVELERFFGAGVRVVK